MKSTPVYRGHAVNGPVQSEDGCDGKGEETMEARSLASQVWMRNEMEGCVVHVGACSTKNDVVACGAHWIEGAAEPRLRIVTICERQSLGSLSAGGLHTQGGSSI